MADIPRLNGAIKALECGEPAFVTFAAARSATPRRSPTRRTTASCSRWSTARTTSGRCATACSTCSTDARSRSRGTLAPAVTPFVRIPPNGGEKNQWIAKQVLDIGVYGVVWPHVSTVEDARNAVPACRYPRPREAPLLRAAGQRGDAPTAAARYWGLTAAGVLPARRRLAAGPGRRDPGRDHVRGEARDREPAEDAGAGAGHRRRADRRRRPVAGSRLSAPVRASRPSPRRSTRSWRSASSTTCRAAIRTSTRRTSSAARAGLPLADAGAGAVVRGAGARPARVGAELEQAVIAMSVATPISIIVFAHHSMEVAATVKADSIRRGSPGRSVWNSQATP